MSDDASFGMGSEDDFLSDSEDGGGGEQDSEDGDGGEQDGQFDSVNLDNLEGDVFEAFRSLQRDDVETGHSTENATVPNKTRQDDEDHPHKKSKKRQTALIDLMDGAMHGAMDGAIGEDDVVEPVDEQPTVDVLAIDVASSESKYSNMKINKQGSTALDEHVGKIKNETLTLDLSTDFEERPQLIVQLQKFQQVNMISLGAGGVKVEVIKPLFDLLCEAASFVNRGCFSSTASREGVYTVNGIKAKTFGVCSPQQKKELQLDNGDKLAVPRVPLLTDESRLPMGEIGLYNLRIFKSVVIDQQEYLIPYDLLFGVLMRKIRDLNQLNRGSWAAVTLPDLTNMYEFHTIYLPLMKLAFDDQLDNVIPVRELDADMYAAISGIEIPPEISSGKASEEDMKASGYQRDEGGVFCMPMIIDTGGATTGANIKKFYPQSGKIQPYSKLLVPHGMHAVFYKFVNRAISFKADDGTPINVSEKTISENLSVICEGIVTATNNHGPIATYFDRFFNEPQSRQGANGNSREQHISLNGEVIVLEVYWELLWSALLDHYVEVFNLLLKEDLLPSQECKVMLFFVGGVTNASWFLRFIKAFLSWRFKDQSRFFILDNMNRRNGHLTTLGALRVLQNATARHQPCTMDEKPLKRLVIDSARAGHVQVICPTHKRAGRGFIILPHCDLPMLCVNCECDATFTSRKWNPLPKLFDDIDGLKTRQEMSPCMVQRKHTTPQEELIYVISYNFKANHNLTSKDVEYKWSKVCVGGTDIPLQNNPDVVALSWHIDGSVRLWQEVGLLLTCDRAETRLIEEVKRMLSILNERIVKDNPNTKTNRLTWSRKELPTLLTYLVKHQDCLELCADRHAYVNRYIKDDFNKIPIGLPCAKENADEIELALSFAHTKLVINKSERRKNFGKSDEVLDWILNM